MNTRLRSIDVSIGFEATFVRALDNCMKRDAYFFLARHTIRLRSLIRSLLTFPLHVARACGRRARRLAFHFTYTRVILYALVIVRCNVLYDCVSCLFDIVERTTRPRSRDRYAGNNPRLIIARQTLGIPRRRPHCTHNVAIDREDFGSTIPDACEMRRFHLTLFGKWVRREVRQA